MESTEFSVISTAGQALQAVNTDADILLFINRASTTASGTLTSPPGNRRGQSFYVSTRSAITSVTTSSARPVFGQITTLAAGGFAHWVYLTETPDAAINTGAWARVG